MENQDEQATPAPFRIGATLAILLVALAAHGQDVVVDCSGQDQNAYQSINEALANLPFVPWHVVMQVTGTCNESIYLGHLHNRTLPKRPGIRFEPPCSSGVNAGCAQLQCEDKGTCA